MFVRFWEILHLRLKTAKCALYFDTGELRLFYTTGLLWSVCNLLRLVVKLGLHELQLFIQAFSRRAELIACLLIRHANQTAKLIVERFCWLDWPRDIGLNSSLSLFLFFLKLWRFWLTLWCNDELHFFFLLVLRCLSTWLFRKVSFDSTWHWHRLGLKQSFDHTFRCDAA